MALTREEINRKLLHLFALLMPIGIFYLPRIPSVSYWVAPIILFVLLLGSVLIEWLRMRHPKIQKLFHASFGHMLREEETQKTTGSTYIIGAAFICSVVFYRSPHISFMTLFLFILGDAIAAITGLAIGRIKIGKKSLEGSLACFILCMLLFVFVFPHLPLLLQQWDGKLPLALAVIASLSITVLELIPMRIAPHFTINDNLAVPVITGLVMQWLYPVFAGTVSIR